MQYPLIEVATGKVANIVVVDDGANWAPPDGFELGVAGGEIGQIWNGSAYVSPSVPVTAEQLRAFAAEKRWLVETGGCPWDGSVVSTDRESQSKLIAAFVMLGAGLRADGEAWKFADGNFRALGNAQAAGMIGAALTHIKTAFAVEAVVLAGIGSGTVTTTDQILAAAWPSNS